MNTYKVTSAVTEHAHACMLDRTISAHSALDALIATMDDYCAKVDTVYSRTHTYVDNPGYKLVHFYFPNYILAVEIRS